MEFSLDGGTTVFITPGPININDISINPSGDGLLCQSEMVLASAGNRHWYINPEMESIDPEDQITDGDVRGWVRTRVGLSNNIRQVIMRREAASGAVEGIFTCEIVNDIINPIRSLSVLYPSELLLTYYNIYIIVLFVKRYYNSMMVCHLLYSLSDC